MPGTCANWSCSAFIRFLPSSFIENAQLFQFGEDLILLDRVSLGDVNAFHDACTRSRDDCFHLHCFEHDERFASLYGLSWRSIHFDRHTHRRTAAYLSVATPRAVVTLRMCTAGRNSSRWMRSVGWSLRTFVFIQNLYVNFVFLAVDGD